MIRLGLLLCIFAKLTTSLEDRVINIDQGAVRGYRPEGEDYFEFYSIPYAKAPTGPNKFGPPLAAPTWNETYEAVQNYVICPQGVRVRNGQIVQVDPKYKAQEDCLFANIYVPDTNETSLPVLVFFHGGAYQYNYGTVRTPIHLLKSKKVVIVNFNYRLGPHGFLCLGTKDVPGNAAMKDQLALLRWVQKNIPKFGGNPNDVTIDGWSAGASSIDLMIVSKVAKGLFHKVIPESGNNVASVAVQNDPLANAKMYASQLGCVDVDNLEKLQAFYTNITYDQLFSVDVSHRPDASTVFAPCVERDVGQELFLDDSPMNILKSGNFSKLPMLYGITDMEGLYRLDDFNTFKDKMNQNFTEFLPVDLQFKDEEDRIDVENALKKFYFNNTPVGNDSILGYIKFSSDVMFAVGTGMSAELQAAAGNEHVYLYEYVYVDINEPNINFTQTRGAGHSAGNKAVMDSGDESTLSKEYQNMKKIMRELWINFVTTGNPILNCSTYPSWPAVSQDNLNYMVLNSTLSVKKKFQKESLKFWHKIYKNHYKHPSPPQS